MNYLTNLRSEKNEKIGLHERNCTQESPDILHYASNTEQFF